jgi:hypothetical protein
LIYHPLVSFARTALGLTGGVLLLVVSVVRSPARPAWEIAPLSAAELALAEQTSQAVTPVVGQIDREAERLRQRLAEAADFAAPARDPFRFRARPDTRPGLIASSSRPETSPDLVAVLRPPAPPPVAMPILIALTEDAGAAGTVLRTAMIAMGDVTAMVKVGDTFDRFRIVGITPTAVEVVDLTSSDRTVTTISIR